jgi:hypothetical protein
MQANDVKQVTPLFYRAGYAGIIFFTVKGCLWILLPILASNYF